MQFRASRLLFAPGNRKRKFAKLLLVQFKKSYLYNESCQREFVDMDWVQIEKQACFGAGM